MLTDRFRIHYGFALFALLVLLAPALAACGSPATPPTADSTEPTTAVATTAPDEGTDSAATAGESPAAATAEEPTATAASCVPGGDPNEKVALTMWAAGYTPSELLPTTGENQNALQIEGIGPIVAAYEELHPNVDIQLVVHPFDDEVRRWMITQLTGGTAPDIMWTQPDWAAEDYRKDWWVPLDDYLQQQIGRAHV